MPHRRDPINAKSAGANGAQHRGKRDNWQAKDTTGAGNERAVSSTPEGRKSPRDERRASLLEAMVPVPSPWTRLADALADPGSGPAVRAVLEAGRNVKAEPGDGVAAFLPNGETLLLLVEADGLLVRRNVTDDEVHLFLSRGEVAA